VERLRAALATAEAERDAYAARIAAALALLDQQTSAYVSVSAVRLLLSVEADGREGGRAAEDDHCPCEDGLADAGEHQL